MAHLSPDMIFQHFQNIEVGLVQNGCKNVIHIGMSMILRWTSPAVVACARPSQVKDVTRIVQGKEVVWVRKTGVSMAYAAADSGLSLLAEYREWLIDGTFWCTPRPYYQVLNVMVVVTENEIVYAPCAHFLLTGQATEDYYEAFLALLKLVEFQKEPKLRIIVDFEKAQKEAFIRAWCDMGYDRQNLTISGCLFHYAQAVYRKYRRLGVGTGNRETSQMLSIFLWLPYFDAALVKDVLEKFEQAAGKDSLSKVSAKFLKYFKRTWMEDGVREMWVGGAENSVSTNCAIESFHSQLNACFNKAHPSAKNLFDKLWGLDRGGWMKAVTATNPNAKPAKRNFGLRNQLAEEHGEKVAVAIREVAGSLGERGKTVSPKKLRRFLARDEKVPVPCENIWSFGIEDLKKTLTEGGPFFDAMAAEQEQDGSEDPSEEKLIWIFNVSK
jgi:hypothetical protein